MNTLTADVRLREPHTGSFIDRCARFLGLEFAGLKWIRGKATVIDTKKQDLYDILYTGDNPNDWIPSPAANVVLRKVSILSARLEDGRTVEIADIGPFSGYISPGDEITIEYRVSRKDNRNIQACLLLTPLQAAV